MQKRKLSAIMFTDIVGYTSLMGEDEKKAFHFLKNNRRIHWRLIRKYRGRMLKEMGDGILSSFSSSIDAVMCALSIQKAATEMNIPLRIGIHQGEVIFEKKDVLGDGVNIASRIQGIAEENGIVISEKVYNDISNKEGLKVEFLGDQALKGVKKPAGIYKVFCEDESTLDFSIDTGELIRPLGVSRRVVISGILLLALLAFLTDYFFPLKYYSSLERDKSIVILPFVEMSDMSNYEYFADGIQDDILNQIANIGDIRVISRTTARKYKSTEKTVPEIAAELNVNYVLEGSIRLDGDLIRIIAQLIDGKTDTHLFSHSYDREIQDVIDLQNDIAFDIAKNLKAQILPAEKERMKLRLSIDPVAYDLYLKGNHELLEYTRNNNERAIEYYRQAIERDSTFTDAWAGLASAYVGRFSRYGMDYSWIDSAEQVVDHAFSLNSKSSILYAAAGLVFSKQGKPELALKANQEALRLNPNNSMAQGNLGFNYKSLGDYPNALKWYKETNDREPLSYAVKVNIGVLYSYFGQPDKAEEWFLKALTLQPRSKQTLSGLAHMYLCYGMDDKALAIEDSLARFVDESWLVLEWMADIERLAGNQDKCEQYYQEAYSRNPDKEDDWYSYSPIGLGYILLKKGLDEEGNELLNKALLNRLKVIEKGTRDSWTYHEISVIYSIQGKRDEALQWLEKAVDAGWNDFRFALRDPWFENIQNDPQFIALMKKVADSLKIMKMKYENIE